ncbi:MAG: hypothetical protein QXT45_06275 [Candidatus Bilamarchaeaceae archaeon]
MYNFTYNPTGLGQVAPGEPGFVGPVKPSAIESVFSVLEKGLQTGLTVYDKVKQLQDLVKARKRAEEQAKIISQLPATPAVPVSVEKPGIDYTTLGLIGVGVLALVLILRR